MTNHHHYEDDEIHPAKRLPNIISDDPFQEYKIEYKKSIEDPDTYWSEAANKYLSWFSPFTSVSSGGFDHGDMAWFLNGKLNVSYNCIDRHLKTKGDQVAIIWEGDEIGDNEKITYNQLYQEVNKIANCLKLKGVKKGDVVTIYMPMIPQVAMVMLACTRIGAIHSIVFAGFSADSLRDRINDGKSKFVVTCDHGRRGGRRLALKTIVDDAVNQCPDVETVFVFEYPYPKKTPVVSSESDDSAAFNVPTENDVPSFPLFPKDVLMSSLYPKVRAYCPCEWMDSEDTLFILYTSGSTGKPKGVAHTTAGYLLNATITTKRTFNIEEGDIYCCAADAGWITGHTYIIYGPLSLGTTTVLFESIPTYPNAYRYWDMIQKHKITQFYTAPTAIRAVMRFDKEPIKNYDLSSLRVLGSVGEPINPEAWKWYNENIGRGNCSIADTYWQTETGSHMATSLPGVIPMKPGSCALPYYGIDFVIVDPTTGKEITTTEAEGVLCVRKPWPSIARTVYGDHDRFLSVYLRPYKGFYFTGDGARRDKDGFYWITGRVDDVINPSGHRLGTAEIESALVACPEVAEAAVVGFPHEIKGEGIACFIILKDNAVGDEELKKKLKTSVRQAISPIATPDLIFFTDLPKTRSGKIMRRILRKIAAGEEDSIGDVSTLADSSVVTRLVTMFKESLGK